MFKEDSRKELIFGSMKDQKWGFDEMHAKDVKDRFIPHVKIGDVWFDKRYGSYNAFLTRHEIPLKLYGFALGFEDVTWISPGEIKKGNKKV